MRQPPNRTAQKPHRLFWSDAVRRVILDEAGQQKYCQNDRPSKQPPVAEWALGVVVSESTNTSASNRKINTRLEEKGRVNFSFLLGPSACEITIRSVDWLASRGGHAATPKPQLANFSSRTGLTRRCS